MVLYTKQKENFFCDDQPKYSCKAILKLGAHETRTRTLYIPQWPPWRGGSILRPRACDKVIPRGEKVTLASWNPKCKSGLEWTSVHSQAYGRGSLITGLLSSSSQEAFPYYLINLTLKLLHNQSQFMSHDTCMHAWPVTHIRGSLLGSFLQSLTSPFLTT